MRENVQSNGVIRDSSSRPAEASDRITGWSDVAAHLRKSVRTAQRWEKICSLPVHRITTPNGEVVYAFRTELDEWLRARQPKVPIPKTSTFPGGPSRPTRMRLLLVGAAIGIAVSTAIAAILLFGVPFAARTAPTLRMPAGDDGGTGPAGWRVEDGRLKVYDVRSERLWEYRFPFALDERAYAKEGGPDASVVAIADLENDGAKELLFIARGKDPADSALFCFDANGAVRFSLQPGRRMRFGDQDYAPPFEVQQIFLTQEPDRRYTLWLVARHHAWFPSVLQKISHTGDVVAEYWNDGRIDSLREARIGTRRVMLVAGTNVEYAGPSLAVLDYDAPGGAAPADDPRFRCATCTSRSPLAAFVMPCTSIWSEMNLAATVDDILIAKNGYITLALHGSRMAHEGGRTGLNVLVTIDTRFDVLDVQANDPGAAPLAAVKAARNGVARAAHLQMFPVLRWLDGQRMPPATQTEAQPAR